MWGPVPLTVPGSNGGGSGLWQKQRYPAGDAPVLLVLGLWTQTGTPSAQLGVQLAHSRPWGLEQGYK